MPNKKLQVMPLRGTPELRRYLEAIFLSVPLMLPLLHNGPCRIFHLHTLARMQLFQLPLCLDNLPPKHQTQITVNPDAHMLMHEMT
jgi:hypothetical protein